MSSALDLWTNFFKSCDIPTRIRERYAQKFVKERIQPYLLKDMSRNDFAELGIDVYGDQLSITNYVKKCGGNPPEFLPVSDAKAQSRIAPDDDEDDDEYDYDYEMEVEEAPRIASKVVNKSLDVPVRKEGSTTAAGMKQIVKRSNAGQLVRVTGVDDYHHRPITISTKSGGILAKSRTIQKPQPILKKLQIQDVSSSSGIPLTGSLRSDHISLKTMVVESSPKRGRLPNDRFSRPVNLLPPESLRVTKEPDFSVNLNLTRPSVNRNLDRPLATAGRRMVNYSGIDDLRVGNNVEVDEEDDDEVLGAIPSRSAVQMIRGESVVGRAFADAGIRRRPKISYVRGGVMGNFARGPRRVMGAGGGRVSGRFGFQRSNPRIRNSIVDRITFAE